MHPPRKALITILAPAILVSTCLLANAELYRVKPGDTLFLIAQRYGTTVAELKRRNGLTSDAIYPLQTLSVERSQAAGYLVRPGDTLFSIASRYGTSVAALKAANGLNGDYLEAGRRLVIPGGTQAGGHLVQTGETLYLIAARYGTTADALMRANGLTSEWIYPGQRLTIPSGGGTNPGAGWRYTVKSGDTLYLLAVRYGTTVAALRQANGLAGDAIHAGQVLTIPGGSGGNPSPPPGISASDRELLARLVCAEAGGEPYAGQVAVAATILNRLNDPKYPKSIPDIIYQYTDGAFQYSPVMDGRINEPASETAQAAVRDALNGWDPSYGATGFYNPAKTDNPWVRSQPVTTVIGDHVFFKY
ncbi:MAG: LysM peptidoglycan-binding domain-containing protein [Patescibacteria group bacterium]